MPLYRLSPDFFLNDFELAGFYFKNRSDNEVSGLEAVRYCRYDQKNNQLYTIARQSLTANTMSQSAGLCPSTDSDRYMFQH